ncbi:MAG: hypothetical protein WC955_02600 [Elusimicrobiota bacterium]
MFRKKRRNYLKSHNLTKKRNYRIPFNQRVKSRQTKYTARKMFTLALVFTGIVLVVYGIVSGLNYLTTSKIFRITKWEISGEGITQSIRNGIVKELRLINLQVDNNIFKYPYKNVERQILAGCSMVEKVKIVSYLPEKVVINAIPRVPLAWFDYKGSIKAVDTYAKVFDAENIEGLPKIVSITGLHKTVGYLTLLKASYPGLYKNIVTIGCDNNEWIKFVIPGNLEIYWGEFDKRKDNNGIIAGKVAALNAVTAEVGNKKDSNSRLLIDCRYYPAGGIVVK